MYMNGVKMTGIRITILKIDQMTVVHGWIHLIGVLFVLFVAVAASTTLSIVALRIGAAIRLTAVMAVLGFD